VNTTRKGSAAELYVAERLEAEGWVVASRRHIGGAGDLLAIHPETAETRLIEVKARKRPYDGFRPDDRQAMRDAPLPPGGTRWLANVRGTKRGDRDTRRIEWVPEDEWP
jgi:hypothetical protein